MKWPRPSRPVHLFPFYTSLGGLFHPSHFVSCLSSTPYSHSLARTPTVLSAAPFARTLAARPFSRTAYFARTQRCSQMRLSLAPYRCAKLLFYLNRPPFSRPCFNPFPLMSSSVSVSDSRDSDETSLTDDVESSKALLPLFLGSLYRALQDREGKISRTPGLHHR